MIRFDPPRPSRGTTTRGARSVLALCACGWRALAGSHPAAESLAMSHIDVAHPAPSLERARALHAAHMRATRR